MAVQRVAGRRGGAGEFLVMSASTPGLRYSVSVAAGDALTCDPRCPGFAYRGHCRHTAMALAILADERRALAPVATVAPTLVEHPATGGAVVRTPTGRVDADDAWVLEIAGGTRG